MKPVKLAAIALILAGCQTTAGTGGPNGPATQNLYIGLSESNFRSGHYCFRPYFNPGAAWGLNSESIDRSGTRRYYDCFTGGKSFTRLTFVNGSLTNINR